MQTIENTSPSPIQVEALPFVIDETTVLRDTAGTPAAKGSDATLAATMELPFAPPIAMDPVDGGKVSITAATPMTEYRGKLYYFTSEANKRAFVANPQTYLTGQLATY
ncbi:MAG TPA: YHS domain-containing protein [Thermoanaerobaculia bacterium]|nr:YHS domain-containing protein [Thermoanaerobaculia bacterium]